MRRLLALLLLPAPLLAADPPKEKGTRYAFLVAAAEYDQNELRPLPFAGKETAEFREVLLAAGFDAKNVRFLHDKAEERRYQPERRKIADELDLLLSKAAADDTVVVLLNGHGVHFTGDATGYFCPVDAKLADKSTLLPMDGPGGVFELLKACKAKRKVLLVNACRNDPRSDLSLAGNKIKLDDDDKDEVPEGIAALYSCKPGERSYYYDPADAKSKGRERSLYMHHLIEAWGKGGKTTIEDVFAAVRQGTSDDADRLFRRKQNPVVRREIKGQGEWLVGGPSWVAFRSEGFEWKGEKRRRVVGVLDLGGEKVEFVKVPAGQFTMGSPDSDQEAGGGEKPAHAVTFTKALWVAKYPTTKGQFAAFVTATKYTTDAETDGKGGYGFDGRSMLAKNVKFTWKNTGWEQTDRHPVVNVSWNDADKYAEWAAKEAQVTVRLMSEAEYEYANRGGTASRYITGDDVTSLEGYANVADKSATPPLNFTVPFDDGCRFTSPVGQYKPNGFGLHDTTGNVFSWCADWQYLFKKEDVTDPPANAGDWRTHHVARGGSWVSDPASNRAAFRAYHEPADRVHCLGFRLCFRLE